MTSRKGLSADAQAATEWRKERILSAWSVQAVLFSKTIRIIKRGRTCGVIRVSLKAKQHPIEGGRSFTLYRMEILRLLNYPKPAHDALIIELPCLMGFRSEEIASWQAKYIHFEAGDCEVLDAKKHRLFTVPLNLLVAKHAEQVLNSRNDGYVIQNESSAWRGRNQPLTTTALWYVWRKYAKLLGLYPSPEEYSPIVGRRFFAAEWFYGQKLSLATLSKIMRHNDIATTARYVSQLIFYEDLKRDYDCFQFKVMQDMAKTRMEEIKKQC